MQLTASSDLPGTRRKHIVVASLATVAIALPMFVLPLPFSILASVALALLPIITIFCFNNPFLLCLLFVAFSFFRLHEVFPVLLPLRIPSLLAMPTLLVLCWHVFLSRSIRIFWTRELKIFLAFFTITTIGVLFAQNVSIAIGYWSATYWKIGIMCLATAWLVKEPEDYNLLARTLMVCGILVGFVAITNKLSGIGLVEGTRVTIGRDIDSVLGDPNDLSLVLLFPLAFACSLSLFPTGWFNRTLGVTSAATIIWAIICTQSRGGLLGTTTIFVLIGWRMVKSKVLLFSVGGVAAVVLFAAMGISGRVSGGAAEEGIDESAMGRIYAWGAAWNMALTRPLHGVGINNFTDNYWAYSAHWDGKNHAVHSTWMNVIAETGFPGFFIFVAMILASLYTSWKSLNRVMKSDAPQIVKAMCMAQIAGIAGFCVSGTFLTQAFTWPIYILLSLTASLDRYVTVHLADTGNMPRESKLKDALPA